ncbi:MAG TPA: M1 family aminopeptidase [Gemmatimonadales bacterium]|jgi:aminopeptidase N|nr:M1 family aminopeptidase [Gemmatimonadales bacterium]
MRPVTATLGLFLLARAALAQSNAPLMANDHYTRSHDYDLVHQRIVVSGFNWDSTSFEGRVTTTLVARRPGLDSVILDEGALLRNTSVTGRSGAELRSGRHGDTLVVFPAHPLGFGDTLVFTVAYHGRVKNGRGLTFVTRDGRPHRPEQIWSQGEEQDNHLWFPTYDFPNDKMTWVLVATVPAADLVVSNGRLVSNLVRGGTRTMTWRQDAPSSTYLLSIVVAPLVRIRDLWEGVPVDYYVYREDSSRAGPLFRPTPDMIAVYSRLTGIRYPWPKYAQTTVADFFGGMENVSATTLVDWLPDARAYADRPWFQYILIPHELAHQWFGDYVTTVNWANMWLNEGFAEFLPGQYWGEKLGPRAEQEYYADEYEQFMEIERRRSMPLASLGSNNIYPKGALVLKMLQHYLGRERFRASLHAYLSRHAYGNASSDDLRQAILDATGENLDWFWDQWVYQAGYPQFDVRAAWDSARASLTLTVRQTQQDSLKPDSTGLRFTVPAVFRMPVTLRVEASGRGSGSVSEVTRRVELDRREQTIEIGGLPRPPAMVIFDDGNQVLKGLSFEQPTAWLANQLIRDADLWNRQWVIGQLAGKAGDSAAARALAAAAVRADHPHTRREAALALAGFPAAVALPALGGALRDSSSAVRSAAVEALGRLAGSPAEALRLAREAFARDTSYQVRAAALSAVVRLDPTGARAVIAQGLRTPSYRDGIQNAALAAVGQTNDTTLVGEVEGLIAAQELAAHVLAILGARGSGRALDLVTRHLNDERAHVRRWMLDACEHTLARANRAVALTQLKAALDGLTHADTREAVSRLIQTIGKD